MATHRVVGKYGRGPRPVIMIDPDDRGRWLVTVEVDTSTDPPGTHAPSPITSGVHWMRNLGGYVSDIEPADKAAVEAAEAAFAAAPPTEADYAAAEKRWPQIARLDEDQPS